MTQDAPDPEEMTLEELREEIAGIDRELVELAFERPLPFDRLVEHLLGGPQPLLPLLGVAWRRRLGSLGAHTPTISRFPYGCLGTDPDPRSDPGS